MANAGKFFLDFLKSTASSFVQTGADVSNAIGNTEARIGQAVGLHPSGPETNQQQFGNLPVIGSMASSPDNPRQFASNAAQVGVSILAPEIARPAERAVLPLIRAGADIGEQAGTKIAQGFGDTAAEIGGQVGRQVGRGVTKGVVGGSAVGAAAGAAQGAGTAKNPSQFAMDFLQGTVQGAQQGAVFGAAAAKGSGVGNEATAVGGPIGRLANALAKRTSNRGAALVDEASQTVDGYKSSTDLVKDYTDMIKGMETGTKGGQMIPDGQGGYTRTSEHSAFYRQYYADHGRAPSKAAWQDEAERQLASGQAAYGASDTYKQLVAREKGGNVLPDDVAAAAAKSDNPAEIERILTPHTGPSVAADVAHAAGTNTDPNIMEQMVKNDIQKKLPAPGFSQQQIVTPEGDVGRPASNYELMRAQELGITPHEFNPAVSNRTPEAPVEPITPQGPTTDVNTPGQVSAEEQSLFASAPQSARPGPGPSDIQSLEQSGNQLSPGDVTQQPETQPAPATPRPFLKGPGDELDLGVGASEVTKQSAIQGMKDILNQGGTTDQAILHYAEHVGGGMQTEFEAKKAISDFLNSPEVDKSKFNAQANPRYAEGAKFFQHETAPGDTEGPVKDAQTVHNAITREGNKALEQVDQLNQHDLELMDKLRSTRPEELVKQADDPTQFMAAAKATKSYTDLAQAVGSGYLDQDVAYRQQYGAPMLFDNTPEGREANLQALAKLKMTPGYGKGRFFQDYDEAAQYGAERQFENFRDDLAYDVQRRANDLSQLTLRKHLEQSFPGQVKEGQIGVDQGGTYRQLLIPGGQKLAMPAAIADKINARAPAPDAQGFLKGYDTINSNLKTGKLGAGGFHAINVAGSYLGQQLLSGHAFTDPEAIGGMVKATFSPEAMRQFTTRLDDQGYLRAGDQFGLKYGPGETAGDVTAQNIVGKLPVIKQLHEAIFNRQIPYMKLRTLQQWMDDHGIDPNNLSKEDIQAGTKVAKELNQNYGGMNRAIQGLTPRTFRLAARGLLATDYTEGQLRSLIDAVSKGGEDGKLARQVVAGKALLFAGLATVGGLAGGEFKGKNPQEVASDIISKTINPQFKMGGYTVSLPETQLSEFAKPVAGSIANAASGKNPRTPIENFATARLAALPSEAFQLTNNKDFYNNPIYGTDYYGRPISAADTVGNVLSGITPIPASQAIQAGKGSESAAAAVANTAGFKASPTYDLSYAPVEGQTYVQLLKQGGAPQKQIDADTQFFDIIGSLSKQKTAALNKAEGYAYKGDNQDAQSALNVYTQKLMKALQPWLTSGGPQYMDPTMINILRSTIPTVSSAARYARTDVKTNPTKYGLPLSASSLAPLATQSLANSGVTGNTGP